jgi:hypothetical protein
MDHSKSQVGLTQVDTLPAMHRSVKLVEVLPHRVGDLHATERMALCKSRIAVGLADRLDQHYWTLFRSAKPIETAGPHASSVPEETLRP